MMTMTEQILSHVLTSSPVASGIRAAYERCAEYGPRLLRQFVIAAVLLFAVGGYYEHKQAEAALARLEADKAIAAMKEQAAETAMIEGARVPLTSSCSSTQRAI